MVISNQRSYARREVLDEMQMLYLCFQASFVKGLCTVIFDVKDVLSIYSPDPEP